MMTRRIFNLFSIIAGLMLISGHWAYGQNVSKLEERFGFKDIKLETHVNEYSTLEPAKHHKDKTEGVITYQGVKGAYTSIGDIKIHDVKVLAYDSMIYEIIVVTEKDGNLYRGLEKAFGKPQNTVGYGSYKWITDRLSLTFRSHSKSKLEMIYHTFSFKKWVREEKEDKIDEVSSDF